MNQLMILNPNGVDPHSVRELDLYAENTYELYGQFKSIIENVKRRIGNKTYDPRKAPRLWQYWYDAAAKRYKKELGYQFPPAIRRQAALERAAEEYQKIVAGEYGEIPVPRRLRKKNPARFKHKRVQPPGRFDPRSFRTIDPGRPGHTKLVVACPRGYYKRGRCQVGTEVQAVLTENPCGACPANPAYANPSPKWHRKEAAELRLMARELEERDPETAERLRRRAHFHNELYGGLWDPYSGIKKHGRVADAMRDAIRPGQGPHRRPQVDRYIVERHSEFESRPNPPRKKRVPVFKTRAAAQKHRKYFLKGKKVTLKHKGKGQAKRYYWKPVKRRKNQLTRGVQGLSNPKGKSASAGYKMFHDANPDRAYKVRVPDSFPKKMYALGSLVKLTLANGTTLRGGYVASGGGNRVYLMGVKGSCPKSARVKQIEYRPPRNSSKAGSSYYHPFKHPPLLRNRGRGFYTLAGKGVKLTPRGIIG